MTLDDMRKQLEKVRDMFTNGLINAAEYADLLISIRRSFICYLSDQRKPKDQ